MMRVAARIFHSEPPPGTGELTAWLDRARAGLAARQLDGFQDAGATDVALVAGPPGIPFGRRLRELAGALSGADGLVLLGSGAIPLATPGDRQALVRAAAGPPRSALANNRFSADVTALAHLEALARLPDSLIDNALPRWLAEAAGYRVDDLRRRWRLQVDLDSPLDLVLLGGAAGAAPWGSVAPPRDVDAGPLAERLRGVRRIAADPSAELIVAGRVSSASLRWLEGAIPARTRALVEERGLKAGSPADRPPAPIRPPSSALGRILDHEGPLALGQILSRLGEAALVDTRVLLAHRLGRDEHAWPEPEDRFASDLLLVDRIRDPWLRELTEAAATAPIPVLLGGHSLVGPGVRLALGGERPGSGGGRGPRSGRGR